jgi:hypothetical protein
MVVGFAEKLKVAVGVRVISISRKAPGPGVKHVPEIELPTEPDTA